MNTIIVNNMEPHDYNGDYNDYNDYDNSNTTDDQFLINKTNGLMICMGAIILLTCVNQVCLSCKAVIHDIRRQNRITHIIINSDEEYINDECSICLDKFQKKNIVNRLPCRHIFHYNCLRDWLKDNNTCPLCRDII